MDRENFAVITAYRSFSDEVDVYFSLEDPEEIRIVTIDSEDTNSDDSEILPFHFSKDEDQGFFYPVVIVRHGQTEKDLKDLIPSDWDETTFTKLD